MSEGFTDFEIAIWAASVSAIVAGFIQIVIFVSNAVTKFRERREKQRDDSIENISSLILEIRDLVCDYWCAPGNEAHTERLGYSVNGRLSYLKNLLEVFFLDHQTEYKIVSTEFKLFLKYCTDGNFLVKNRSPEIQRTAGIEIQTYALIHACSSQREKLPIYRFKLIRSCFRKILQFKRWLPIAIIALLMIVGYLAGVHEYLTISNLIRHHNALSEFVSGNLLIAAASYFAIYATAVAISIPGAAILTITGGFILGWFVGGLVIIFAATLGASIIFLAAKSSFGESLRRKAGPKLTRFSDGFNENAFSYILFLRLVPVFPFWLMNVAPALFNVSLRTYATATLIGIMPGTFVYAFIGEGLDSVIEAQEESNPGCSSDGSCSIDFGALVTTEIIIALVGLGILAIVPVALKKIRGRKEG